MNTLNVRSVAVSVGLLLSSIVVGIVTNWLAVWIVESGFAEPNKMTLIQVSVSVVTILILLAVGHALLSNLDSNPESQPELPSGNQDELSRLKQDIASSRKTLERIRRKMIPTNRDRQLWQHHTTSIQRNSQQLHRYGIQVPIYAVDTEPPPQVGVLGQLYGALGIFLAFPFLLFVAFFSANIFGAETEPSTELPTQLVAGSNVQGDNSSSAEVGGDGSAISGVDTGGGDVIINPPAPTSTPLPTPIPTPTPLPLTFEVDGEWVFNHYSGLSEEEIADLDQDGFTQGEGIFGLGARPASLYFDAQIEYYRLCGDIRMLGMLLQQCEEGTYSVIDANLVRLESSCEGQDESCVSAGIRRVEIWVDSNMLQFKEPSESSTVVFVFHRR